MEKAKIDGFRNVVENAIIGLVNEHFVAICEAIDDVADEDGMGKLKVDLKISIGRDKKRLACKPEISWKLEQKHKFEGDNVIYDPDQPSLPGLEK